MITDLLAELTEVTVVESEGPSARRWCNCACGSSKQVLWAEIRDVTG